MKKEYPVIQLTITDFGAEGVALGRFDNKVVFVPYSAPGDVVNVKIVKKRKSYLEGVIESFVEKSPMRIQPFCPHFGYCGGCSWQHIPYHHQVEFKKKQVEQQLRRIGKISVPHVNQTIASDFQVKYRNKLEFSFTAARWLTPSEIADKELIVQRNGLGFHIPGRFDKIFNVETCMLQPGMSDEIRNFVRQYAIENQLDFFSPVEQTGWLRNMIIRNNSMDEWMVIFAFTRFEENKLFAFLEAVSQKFEKIKSLIYFINAKRNDSLSDLPYTVYKGEEFIKEKAGNLEFKIGPKSFFQTNTSQTIKLYSTALEFAQLTGKEIVYDLYTGTGTIACFVASHCAKVIGIECIEEAIADAWFNATMNHIENAGFFCGDIKTILTDGFIRQNGPPDVVITDPPRAGMHPEVVEFLLKVSPDRIVYISCNPATQARDVALLSEQYNIEAVQPVDMFPHTHHIENIILLRKIKPAVISF